MKKTVTVKSEYVRHVDIIYNFFRYLTKLHHTEDAISLGMIGMLAQDYLNSLSPERFKDDKHFKNILMRATIEDYFGESPVEETVSEEYGFKRGPEVYLHSLRNARTPHRAEGLIRELENQ